MKKSKEEHLKTIINKMFEIAGNKLTYDDVKETKEDWWHINTMTQAQNDEWREWMEKYLTKQKLTYSKKLADREARMIDLMYGLRIVDPVFKTKTKENDKRKTRRRNKSVSRNN